jgi:4-amino-4-deoxy-L-arabinose transferase-like glycosyltransferase
MTDKTKIKTFCSAKVCLLAITFLAIWLILEIIGNPIGNFPLNDDWNYARSVKILLEESRLAITTWSLAASLTHILIGYLSCLIFGFSFEHLRFAVLITSLIGHVVLFYWLISINQNKIIAFIAICTLAFNPIYFILANTFMTDVPFVTLAISTIYLLSSQLHKMGTNNNANHFIQQTIFCTVFTTLTCLSRQIGIVIPIAYLFALIKHRSLKGKPLRVQIISILPLVIPILAIAAFQFWLAKTTFSLSYATETHYLMNKFSLGAGAIILEFLTNIIRALVYCGLFFIPALPILLPAFISQLERKQKLFFIALSTEMTILISLGLIFRNSLMPLADNVLFNFGLGPILVGGNILPPNWPIAPIWFWQIVTFTSTCAGTILVSMIVLTCMSNKKQKNISLYFYLAILFLFLTVIFVRGFFDRYLIFVIPLLFAIFNCLIPADYNIANSLMKKLNIGLSIIFILLFASFSAFATRDYFVFSRARWQALNYLTNTLKISPEIIDGGLEFNGWHSYNAKSQKSKIVFNASMKQGDDWLVSLDEQKGYKKIVSFPFQHSLIKRNNEVIVSKKQEK